jgi:hypothetical protein
MSLKEHGTKPVQCPHCKETNVEQIISSFVAVTSKKS